MRIFKAIDFFGIFSEKKDRLQEAIEKDSLRDSEVSKKEVEKSSKTNYFRALHPNMLLFLCSTSFLNRTKATLRLGYEPVIDPDKSLAISIDWYKNYFGG